MRYTPSKDKLVGVQRYLTLMHRKIGARGGGGGWLWDGLKSKHPDWSICIIFSL